LIDTGKGSYEPKNVLNLPDFEVIVYRYKDTLIEEINNASLVIGHAGNYEPKHHLRYSHLSKLFIITKKNKLHKEKWIPILCFLRCRNDFRCIGSGKTTHRCTQQHSHAKAPN
jgi:hypothetical protein